LNVQEALHRLKEDGHKYTEKREDMLRLLFDEDRYLTARDVLIALQDNYPGISVDTIYRNLSLFCDLDILEEAEWDGERHFRFSCPEPHHHHHFICLSCGMTKNLHECPMETVNEDLDGYTIKGHKFEIYGYCSQCG
jgi:Fur family zinc uptake transcriptional regulator